MLIYESGVFIVLFSASIVMFMFVAILKKGTSEDDFDLCRRRGLSSRATVAMFAISGLSFLLATLYVGAVITAFVPVIRKTLVDNIDEPLSVRLTLAHDAAKGYNIMMKWSINLPVSRNRFTNFPCPTIVL